MPPNALTAALAVLVGADPRSELSHDSLARSRSRSIVRRVIFIDPGALVAFLAALAFVSIVALGFGIALCRGVRKERRQHSN